MKIKIEKEKHVYSFSKSTPSVATIKSGDILKFETYDCFCGQIKNEDDEVSAVDFNRVNPVTGPVYVENAEEGQTLKIEIKKIDLANQAVVMTGKGAGVLGSILTETTANIMKIHRDRAVFKGIELPLNKMVGVIGVAPQGEAINCGTPGSHGGNMDCKIIGEDSIVYLPIFTKGALLAMGDVHAVMGDGEIGVSGAESAAEIEVKVELLENISIKNPIIETKDAFYTVASALTLDEAQEIAVMDMFDILHPKCSLSKNDLVMLLSLAGNLEICQVVDPLKTIRFRIGKDLLKKLNVNFI